MENEATMTNEVATSVAPAESTATTAPAESAPKEETKEHEDGSARIVKDEKGNSRLEITGDIFGSREPTETEVSETGETEGETKEDTTETQPNEEKPPTEPSLTEPNYYESMDELVKASAAGMLDESRVSPEQRQVLMNLAVQKQYEQQQEAQMREMQTQKALAEQQAMQRIMQEARTQAMASMNLKADDLENIEYMENGTETKKKFEEAYSTMATAKLKDYLRSEILMEQRITQHNSCMAEIRNFAMQENLNEPNFAKITAMMDADKMTMPYGQAQRIIQAEANINNQCCTMADLQVMREYYDTCKRKVYQQSTGVTKIPQRTSVPKVENVSQPTKENTDGMDFDFSKLRNLSAFERSKVMTGLISKML